MMVLPSKEIAKQLRFANGSVYYIGSLSEQQKQVFEEYKKKLDESNKHRYD